MKEFTAGLLSVVVGTISIISISGAMFILMRVLDEIIERENPFKRKKNLKNFLEMVLPLMFCEDKIIISVFYEEGFDYYNVGMLESKENQIKILGERLKYKVVRIYEYKSGIEIVLMKEKGYGK